MLMGAGRVPVEAAALQTAGAGTGRKVPRSPATTITITTTTVTVTVTVTTTTADPQRPLRPQNQYGGRDGAAPRSPGRMQPTSAAGSEMPGRRVSNRGRCARAGMRCSTCESNRRIMIWFAGGQIIRGEGGGSCKWAAQKHSLHHHRRRHAGHTCQRDHDGEADSGAGGDVSSAVPVHLRPRERERAT